MISLLYLSLFVNLIAVFALGGWLLYIFLKDSKTPKDKPFILNFLSGFTEGRFLGREESIEQCSNGRHLITFSPKDIDIESYQGSEIKPEKIIVDKGKLISLPKNSFSRDKSIDIALPKSAHDFPDNVRDNLFVKALMWATELENLTKLEVDMLREGHIRKDLLLKEIGTGEISKEFLAFSKELMQDHLENAINPRGVNKQQLGLPGMGGFPPQQRENE